MTESAGSDDYEHGILKALEEQFKSDDVSDGPHISYPGQSHPQDALFTMYLNYNWLIHDEGSASRQNEHLPWPLHVDVTPKTESASRLRRQMRKWLDVSVKPGQPIAVVSGPELSHRVESEGVVDRVESGVPAEFRDLLPTSGESVDDPAEAKRVSRDLSYVVSRLTDLYTARRAKVWLTSYNYELNTRPIDAIIRRQTGSVIHALDLEDELGYS